MISNTIRPAMIVLLILLVGSSISKRTRHDKIFLKRDGEVIAKFISKSGDGQAKRRCEEYKTFLKEKEILNTIECLRD